MVHCPRCGIANQPAAKFCASCGAPLQTRPPAGAPAAGGAPPGWGAPPQQQPPPGAPGSPYAPPPAPQYGAPASPQQGGPPGWGPPPGAYQPPPGAPGQYGQPPGPPGAQQPPGWGQPPGMPQQAPQAAPPGYPQPYPQQYGAPPAQYAAPPGGAMGGFAPAPDQHRIGASEGLNPFGATMAPEHGGAAPAADNQPRWNDPAAFAATAPPPVTDEQRGGLQPRPTDRPADQRGPQDLRPSSPGAGPSRTGARPAAGVDPEQVPQNAPRVVAGFLVSYENNELGMFWPIFQGRNDVGRKGAAEGLVVEIDHPTTSSRHAVILASARPARIKIEDPGSTNGTFLEDGKMEHGRKYELKDGDVVRFGAFSTIVKII